MASRLPARGGLPMQMRNIASPERVVFKGEARCRDGARMLRDARHTECAKATVAEAVHRCRRRIAESVGEN